MVNKIDRSFEDVGLFKYYTDSNCCYILDIKESSKGSGLWFINLFKEYGTPDKSEVFSTLKNIANLVLDYCSRVNIEKFLIIIDADNDDERRKKTIAFSRYINSDWEYQIQSNPEFKISGKRGLNIINTNCIFIKKKINDSDKYCSNCGNRNENYKFCPNCGFKIKED